MDAPETIKKRARDYGRWVTRCEDPKRANALLGCWNAFKRDVTGVSDEELESEFKEGGVMSEEINQTEGAVHSPETMDLMDAEVLKKTNVPLYFDNGVDEKILVGTASIEPDGEVLMQIDNHDFIPTVVPHPEIWMEPDVEEVWVKRRTY